MTTPMQSREQLPIRTVSALTGVSTVTLRAWERRYGLVRPVRTPSGHRLYTHAHVEQIRRVLALIERGIPVSRARQVLDAEAATRAPGAKGGPWRGYQDRMAAAIAGYDDLALDDVYDEALSLHQIESVTRLVLLPLLERLGERWQKLDGAIAEEHFFATYLRSKLGARLQHRMRYATGPRLVVACAPGEHHEVGLLLFAIEARSAGLRPLLLGADTPLPEAGTALHRAGADGVVISSSVDPPTGVLEHDLPALVASVTVPVFVGGATSVRHHRAVTAAGAVPLGCDLEDGVRLLATTLHSREHSA
jgi:MerR family transcriptional regulator, light-induced transcriptional regulator